MMPTPHIRRFRLILAAVDFSRASAKALRYAAATARACGGQVEAIHALDPLLSAAAARGYAESPLVAETEAALERFVRRTLGENAGARVRCAVVVGSARQVLMLEARRRRPDLVVIGTSGRRGVAKLFFGSTTEALLRRYHGAVMVVPPHSPNPGPRWPHGSIVAAVGAGPHRRAMITAAARTAEVFGAFLTVTALTAQTSSSHPRATSLMVLPLPDAARLRTFAQGTSAYAFVRGADVPVMVLRTGRRLGHPGLAPKAA
jgi:nucleotide-binding universal stress UspA family protein